MKKFIIIVLACLPMLGFAEYEVDSLRNNVTFVNNTNTHTNVNLVHGACVMHSGLSNRINLGPGQVSSVIFASVEISGDNDTLCGVGDRKRMLFRTAQRGYFSVETGHREHDRLRNLRSLKTVNFKISYERKGIRNVITLDDITTK